MEVAIAEHSLCSTNNLSDSQSCQISMERLSEDGESQRNAIQVMEELTEGLKTANEWQAGVVQTLGRKRQWQVTMSEKFQELRESHNDVMRRVQEMFETVVESRVVVDQTARKETTASSCSTEDSSKNFQRHTKANRTVGGNIEAFKVNCGFMPKSRTDGLSDALLQRRADIRRTSNPEKT